MSSEVPDVSDVPVEIIVAVKCTVTQHVTVLRNKVV